LKFLNHDTYSMIRE